MSAPDTLSPAELQARRAGGAAPVLIDVRMPEEWAICRIEGATLVPLPTLAERLADFDPAAETVVYCHVGMRSALAAAFLRRQGFSRVYNLSGGIDAWAADIEPEMVRY